VRGAEVVTRQAVVEFFADLADNHPVVALAAQRAQAFFAAAIGRRGVDQVDAQLAGLGSSMRASSSSGI
jgi:hypothetical protein